MPIASARLRRWNASVVTNDVTIRWGPDAPADSSKAAAPYMPLLFIRKLLLSGVRMSLLRAVLIFNRAPHVIA
ncbi:hypothetical protein GFL89_06955 [Rhizobium leguminosarum bv. viciae]|nr:hypothetical protein [Rhizobium leguminosarum bv. viciae]